MTDDWPQIKARLGELQSLLERMRVEQTEVDIMGDHEQHAADIRAALQRVEELERRLARESKLLVECIKTRGELGERRIAAESKLENSEEECIWLEAQIRDLEAKLAKVVEALEKILAVPSVSLLFEAHPTTGCDCSVCAARAALAVAKRGE